MPTNQPIVVSAPGKVLLAGGYLVLSPTYPGHVIATDSRFYSVISRREPAAKDQGDDNQQQKQKQSLGSIKVRSPQFQGALWEFIPILDEEGGIWNLAQTRQSRESTTAGANPFISLAILYTLRLVSELRGSQHLFESLRHGIDVAVLADNDFYSQRQGDKPPSSSYLRSLPPFNAKPIPIQKVHKTGLGSSAAMTTSLVGSLMAHLGALSSFSSSSSPSSSSTSNQQQEADAFHLSPRDLALVHNLSQLAHCAAQGKVGSGFDVSSATWGSHLFRRFDPEVIRELLDGEKVEVEGSELPHVERKALSPYLDPSNPLWFPSPLSSSSGGPTFPTAVEGLHASRSSGSTLPNDSDDDEDEVKDREEKVAQPPPLSLPPFIKMVLADVDAGSNTPSLVGKVMQWKKEKPEWAEQLFAILATSVQSLSDAFLTLQMEFRNDEARYQEVFEMAVGRFSKEWDLLPPSPIKSALIESRQALRSIRAGMRELGQRSGAPVEPDEMGRVIRACVDGVEGVLGGGVPGAGGFDALYILYLCPPSSITSFSTSDSNLSSDSTSTSPTSTSTSTPEPTPAKATDTVRSKIESIWSGWEELSVGPLLSSAGQAQGSFSHAQVSSHSPSAATSMKAEAEAKAQAEDEDEDGKKPKAEKGGLRIQRVEDVKGLKEALERDV